MQKGVDYLPMAKPVVQLTTRGSAATERFLIEWCRLLVVLCEGCDLCPQDGESQLEACEIEGQGGLVNGSSVRTASTFGESVLQTVHGLLFRKGSVERPE